VSEDIFDCCDWEGLLLASSGQRPGMLPNLLQCTEQPPTKNDPAQVSVVVRLRDLK
jgi:hypothetical protein